MGVVSLRGLLEDASKNGYAVGAFTTFNMEYTRALIEVAEELASPIIVMFGVVESNYAGIERLSNVVKNEIRGCQVPVAFHFDHGNSFETVMRAITCGFTSVMFDGSQLPYEENVEITREIVRVAHAVGIEVEGEIGVIGGSEGEGQVTEERRLLTDPEEALDFVNKTGVDALAIAIGTSHGFYRAKPHLDIERLKEIGRKVKVPLVLHGGSDTPQEDLLKAIKSGISKININSDLKAAFTRGLRESLNEDLEEIAFEKFLSYAIEKMKGELIRKLELFGSVGRG